MTEAVRRGREHDARPVRGPAAHHFVSGMERQALRHTTAARHHVYVAVAVVLARERDHAAVRREMRHGFATDAGRERARIAAFATDDPEVAAIVEDDLGLTQRRMSQ